MKNRNNTTDYENPDIGKLTEEQLLEITEISPDVDLGDEQRIKVMSPGMLVIKRFVRNKLAIVGTVILVAMFVFSFIGGLLTPYDETQVFKHIGIMSKDYVYATQSTELKYYAKEGMDFDSSTHARFILEKNKGNEYFENKEISYRIITEGENFYRIQQGVSLVQVTNLRGVITIIPEEGENELSQEFLTLTEQAVLNSDTSFIYDSVEYYVARIGRNYSVIRYEDAAVESVLIIEPLNRGDLIDYELRYHAQKSLEDHDRSGFEANGKTYEVEFHEHYAVISEAGGPVGSPYAVMSDFSVNTATEGVIVSMEFREAMHEAIKEEKVSFKLPDDSTNTEYTVKRVNNVYTIKTETETQLITIHEDPSAKHWLGTNAHGMDNLTRLMYGGRISLSIGFVVVAIEILLGIILGGVAGYFGKWVDMLIMRVVDVFNCIPFLPLLIILGSVMDKMNIDPKLRIYYMMLTLGLISWPGIARVVRGQILSLREQEFMIAAEATGISTYKRIFQHLVPNVIPQLIVFATLGLGGIIIYESTLSFLGLGVKFPYASWGNIISGITTAYEMTNFWFTWVPAGLAILITVLGFNFVGDGLRDAYDPKMKR